MTSAAAPAPETFETTDDAFLGGKINLLQPTRGYRAGLDAVLLAASVRASAPDESLRILDVGAGVGTVGLSVAARLTNADVTLVERDKNFVGLAELNIARNSLDSRCRVVAGDVTGDAATLASVGLAPETFDHVLANPPFHDVARGTAPPHHLKTDAHAMDEDALDAWARFIVRVTAPGRRATLIHKADALPRLLHVLTGRFGGLTVLPIVPYAGSDCHRILVTGQKGSRAPFRLLSPFVVHMDKDGPQTDSGRSKFTPEAEAIFRHGEAISFAVRPR